MNFTERARPARISESSAYFDTVAEEYAGWYQTQSPGGYALRVRQKRLVELIGGAKGKVLDAGCGPGILAKELLNLGCEVWGVDASYQMIKKCAREFADVPRAHFAVGDVAKLPFPDGFFEIVICMGVIRDVATAEPDVKEMIRVTKPDGTLLISFPNMISPYAAWRTFLFYPGVALLRPIYYLLRRKPEPISLYNFSLSRQLRWMFSFLLKPNSTRTAIQLLTKFGAELTNITYFNFNVFLSPLDELFPRSILKIIEKLERLRFGRFKWLGAGFITKAKRKRSFTKQ